MWLRDWTLLEGWGETPGGDTGKGGVVCRCVMSVGAGNKGFLLQQVSQYPVPQHVARLDSSFYQRSSPQYNQWFTGLARTLVKHTNKYSAVFLVHTFLVIISDLKFQINSHQKYCHLSNDWLHFVEIENKLFFKPLQCLMQKSDFYEEKFGRWYICWCFDLLWVPHPK